MEYRVDIEAFEGPLDLLLHLVQQEKVDISDIPIAKVLDQYLAYLNLMEELNIDLSGDFILMASELALIKSKMLLPAEGQEDEEEGVDPRADLIRRLLEYQRYKEGAVLLMGRPLLERDVFVRGQPEDLGIEATPLEADIFNLVTCFSQILARAPKVLAHEVMATSMSVTERIYELIEQFKLSQHQALEFKELFKDKQTRDRLIVTFLAILEMCRLKILVIRQMKAGESIFITPQLVENSEIKIDGVTLH